MSADHVWIGFAEVRPARESDILGSAAGAFLQVLAWTGNDESFRVAATGALARIGLDAIGFEDVELFYRPAGEGASPLADLAKEVEQTGECRLGTLHLYEPEESPEAGERVPLGPGRTYRLPNGDCVVARFASAVPLEGQPVDPDDYRDPESDPGSWVLEPLDGHDRRTGVYLLDEATSDLYFIGPHTRSQPGPDKVIHEICDTHTPTALRLDDLEPLP